MTSYQTALASHCSVLLSVVPQGPARYQAEVGAWAGSARFENTFGGHHGMGYVTGLDTEGSSVAVAIAVPKAGSRSLQCRVANATGGPSTLTVSTLDPDTGVVHGTATLSVPSTMAWTSWQTVPVTITMAAGTNLVVCVVWGRLIRVRSISTISPWADAVKASAPGNHSPGAGGRSTVRRRRPARPPWFGTFAPS